jgi:hypothetical protein
MQDDERTSWFDEIQILRTKLIARDAGAQDVADLASKIVARARETIGDTKWMEHAVHGIGVGLNWNDGAAKNDERTLVGFQLALSSAALAMASLDTVGPAYRSPSADIDGMIKKLRPLGLTDARPGMF